MVSPHRKTATSVKRFWRLGSVLVLGLVTSHASAVELCHVANAGWLIKGNNASVVIDGLMQEDQYEGRFALPSEKMLGDMIDKTGLFEDLTYVLSTHRHGDHFDPKATIRQIRNTSGVHYGVPADAIATLAANGLTEVELERVTAIADGPQSTFDKDGVVVQTFDVDHGPNQPQNVGYRVTVDGVSFFHTGDINTSRAQLASAGINSLPVNALIMPFWYGFQNPEQRAAIDASWDYETVVLTHFNPEPQPWMQRFGGMDGVQASIKESFEKALVVTEEGKCASID